MKTGDVVYLNSGSPKLTVERVRGDGYVDVRWMRGDEFAYDAFPEACLRSRRNWMQRMWEVAAGETLALSPRRA